MIREMRENKGITQIELAEAIGVSERTMRRYEQEEDIIQVGILKKIFAALDMSTNELEIVHQTMSTNAQCPPMQNNVHQYDSLVISKSSVSQPQNVSKSLTKQDLNVNKSDSISSHTNTDDSIQIPIFDVYASAGHGLINEEHIESYATFDKSFLRKNFGLTSFVELSIITSKGDSMIPTLPENCQLLIQKGLPREGQICVTRIDDELYIKRLQKRPKYKLISDNKSYDDIDLEGEDYEILGIVVGMFQKMT